MARRSIPETDSIVVIGASEHNLQNIDITLPRDTLTVFTGVSGSGKSSLAFDTLFKEGQRRFLESLSPYARQFLGQMEKPKVEHVEGLSPTVSIDQKTVNRNPRSTVGTITELYDHYRLLMARLGQPHCPDCGVPISTLTADQITERMLIRWGERDPGADTTGIADGISNGKSVSRGRKSHTPPLEGGTPSDEAACLVLAPMVRERKGEYRAELTRWHEQGFLRARIDGQVRRLDETITLVRYEKHTLELVLDRLTLAPRNRSRLTEAVEKALELSGGLVTLSVQGEEHLFSSTMACPKCQTPIPELEPRLFSFNDPQGACPKCHGLGLEHRFVETRLTDPARSLAEGTLTCFTAKGNLVFTDMDRDFMVQLARALKIDPRTPWGKLPAAQRALFLEGNGGPEPRVRSVFRDPELLLREARSSGLWPGLYAVLGFIGHFVGGALDRYRDISECPVCQGQRLNPVALAVRFREHNIHTLSRMSIEEAVAFYNALELTATEDLIGRDIFREIKARLSFLNDVGVGYLTLERGATTLSGGEAQRIRLAAQVGSGLQGVLYILDEPSIGLHQTDNRKLIQTLRRLRDTGNTVYVVEHDQETIASADHVVDLGPGAGSQGGHVLAQGSVAQVMAAKDSLSGRYLSGEMTIAIPKQRRIPGKAAITIHGARRNNLQNLTVRLPLGVFVAVTGVSGSGKSTLVHDLLKPALSRYLDTPGAGDAKGTVTGSRTGDFSRITGLQHLDKVIEIDQTPIGRTPRSNP
ncbi:MAG: excinuclease ABC subunit UvrA, partial [Deltaproteobacteria bacterium]|nr:excinuclease ABC subunit UvrA [Deltaproteobacteria bacterium]